jgi:hypothetical protein
MGAHNQNIKKKSHYNDLFLVAAVQTPLRQHYKSIYSNTNASRKETVHKHRGRSFIDYRFLPWENS